VHPLAENPFFVLELPPLATPMEIERQGKKLLGMLELQLGSAATFPTPYGPQPRTPERVREAVQLLLDPARRLPFEPWAAWTPPSSSDPSSSDPSSSEPAPTPSRDAFDAGALVWWSP
jgi:hypothetical protein